MSKYYLGNTSKMPPKSAYREKFGWNYEMFYTVDKLNRGKVNEFRKQVKETNKKASVYTYGLGWGCIPSQKQVDEERKKYN